MNGNGVVFDKENYYRTLLNKMLNRQKHLNDLTFPSWKKELSVSDWQCAIIDEVAEALNSIGYKWWKKQNVDYENLKVEITDIIHFMLSKFMYLNEKELIYFFAYCLKDDEEMFRDSGIKFWLSEYEVKKSDKKELLKVLLEELAGNNQKIIEQIKSLSALITVTGGFEHYYRAYFVKNILNEFRQKHGYKDGSYIKMWKIDLGEGIKEYEDNQVVFEIAKNIPLEKLDELLMEEIEKVYKEIKA